MKLILFMSTENEKKFDILQSTSLQQMMDVGLASGIRALNLTHTGELGWILYIPNEYALHVYDRLVSHGEKYGLALVG